MGVFLDTNDPLKWEQSPAPQKVDHPDFFELRGKLVFNLAVEHAQRPAAIEEAERRGVARAVRTKEANSLWMMVDWLMESRRDMADIDGGELEHALLKYGILDPFEATEPCDPEDCICAEVGPFPTECYRTAPWMEQDAFFGVTQPVEVTDG